MKRLSWLMLILILVACGPAAVVTPTVTPSPSSTPVMVTATGTATPTSTPQTGLEEQCVEMLPAIPKDSVPPGILAVGKTLMNFRQQEQRNIPGFLGVGVSPNRKWLAYAAPNDDYAGLLYVESADGQQQRQLPFNYDWVTFDNITWLDNERVVFPIFDKNQVIDSRVYSREVPMSTLVLNTITGEQLVLPADYPNFAHFEGASTQLPLHFGNNNVVYHPSLKLVIYPQEADDGDYIALWDRESGQTVAKVLSGWYYEPSPLWLPNGNAFVVTALPDNDHLREWFMVSRNGEIVQLTHFGDLYSQPWQRFSNVASLSPDGHYLAFGLYINSEEKLVILNLQTLEAVNTCVQLQNSNIAWSPDSQYLAVQYLVYDSSQSSFVVVNFKQRWAVNLSTSVGGPARPEGWLDTGE